MKGVLSNDRWCGAREGRERESGAKRGGGIYGNRRPSTVCNVRQYTAYCYGCSELVAAKPGGDSHFRLQLETICCCVSPGLLSPADGDPARASAVCAGHGGHTAREQACRPQISCAKDVLALAKRLAGARRMCTSTVGAATRIPLSSTHKLRSRWPRSSLARIPYHLNGAGKSDARSKQRMRWGALREDAGGDSRPQMLPCPCEEDPL